MKRSFLSALLCVYFLMSLLAYINRSHEQFRLETTPVMLFDIKPQFEPKPTGQPKTVSLPKPVLTPSPTPIKPPPLIRQQPPDAASHAALGTVPAPPPEPVASPPAGQVANAPQLPPRVIVSAGQLPTAPKLMYGESAQYPEFAREHGISGKVKVRLLVNEEGRIEDVAILEGNDKFGFVTAIKKAVNTWKFEPLHVDGQLVAFYLIKPFDFQMED